VKPPSSKTTLSVVLLVNIQKVSHGSVLGHYEIAWCPNSDLAQLSVLKSAMKKAPVLQFEQLPGQKFPDREAAQRAAMPQLAESLQAVIQDLLERGELVNIEGKIIPNSNKAKS
jgi:hypothetical protein